MSQASMDRVLNYPSLPSLPGVAMRVLELTRNPRVSMQDIAQTVAMDAALATKVLKTVNSSYYGLSQPCPSIPRAMSMLGMNTVKSIVLGFSLVEMSKGVASEGRGFDMQAYWRRAVYSAVAARAVALRTKCCDPEEAFTGAMIADIGVLACFAALKDEYDCILAASPENHADCICSEQAALNFDHTQVGQRIAEKWRLPGQLCECVGFHHAPEKCHPANQSTVRCVALGQFAAAALTLREPKSQLGGFVVRCRDWFGLDRAAVDALLEATTKGAADLAKSLELKTGEKPDLSVILAQAQEAIVETQVQSQHESEELRRANEALSLKTITDAMTGAFNRAHFDTELARCFETASKTNAPLALLFIDADRFKSVNDTLGHQAGDAVLKELSRRTRGLLAKTGQVFRYGGEEFAIILPGVGLAKAAKIAELVRTVIAKAPFDLREYGIDAPPHPVTISIGVSAYEAASASFYPTPESLTKAADEGVYAAKHAGRNRVSALPPKRASAAGPDTHQAKAGGHGPTVKPTATGKHLVMIIEDDPLAAKLLAMLFAKHPEFMTVVSESADAALARLSDAAKPLPHCILCDMHLHGATGMQFLTTYRSMFPSLKSPVYILSTADDESTRGLAIKAGATDFFNKAKFVREFEQMIQQVKKSLSAPHAAAA